MCSPLGQMNGYMSDGDWNLRRTSSLVFTLLAYSLIAIRLVLGMALFDRCLFLLLFKLLLSTRLGFAHRHGPFWPLFILGIARTCDFEILKSGSFSAKMMI